MFPMTSKNRLRRRISGLVSRVLGAVALGLGATCGAAMAEPITAVLTSAAPGAPLFVAAEEGLFAKHGIAIKPVLLPLMPMLPAALVSGSGQIAFMTTTTFIQAVDGGIDLVAIAGGAITSHTVADASAVVQPDLDIKTASDFIGHSMGVPGLGAYYHVIFRYWLMQHGVDPAKVRFIEVSFPQMLDSMRGRAVDGVVTLDPAQSQILNAHVGKVAVPIYAEIPEDKPIVMYVSTREWAAAHPADVANFRAAIAAAQGFTAANPERAKQDLAKYAPMPPAVLEHVSIGAQSAVISEDGLRWWVDVMGAQQMLATKIDIQKLTVK